MKQLIAIFGSLLLLAVTVFCLFGFIATFETTDNTTQFIAFRIGYAMVGVGCLIGMGFLIVNVVRGSSTIAQSIRSVAGARHQRLSYQW